MSAVAKCRLTYANHRPTQFDGHITLGARGHWLVAPTSQNRDSGPLDQSNFAVALARLGGESETVEVPRRFGHWGPGWYEIILVDPNAPHRVAELARIEDDLDRCPVLDEDDYSEREQEHAAEVWRNCYSQRERVAFLREHDGCEWHGFADLLGCVRGKYPPYTRDGYGWAL